MSNKIKRPNTQADELDLKCFMNLMVVLIPMLLISAEFAKVAVIDIKLPQGGTQTKHVDSTQPEDQSDKLKLTAIITDSVVTIGAKGGFLPSLHYREFHRYVTRDGALDTLVEYAPGAPMPVNGRTGAPLTIYDRYDIYLHAVDENREIQYGMYTQFGEMLTNSEFRPVKSANVGDTLFALTNPRRRVVVSNATELANLQRKQLSAYDMLKNELMMVKERYRGVTDHEDIIIAAENEVIYDKIIQIMDVARSSEFPNIAISKLRA